MNKKIVLGVVAIIVIAAAVVGIVLATGGYKSDKNAADSTKTSSMDMNSDSSSSSDTSDNDTPTATNTVTIQDFAFSPASITVKAGTTVTWTNKDSTVHTVTETDGKTGPDSGTMEQGKAYSFTYVAAGTYAYHCNFHSGMTGTVTVTE